jgi:hypothetical protein
LYTIGNNLQFWTILYANTLQVDVGIALGDDAFQRFGLLQLGQLDRGLDDGSGSVVGRRPQTGVLLGVGGLGARPVPLPDRVGFVPHVRGQRSHPKTYRDVTNVPGVDVQHVHVRSPADLLQVVPPGVGTRRQHPQPLEGRIEAVQARGGQLDFDVLGLHFWLGHDRGDDLAVYIRFPCRNSIHQLYNVKRPKHLNE